MNKKVLIVEDERPVANVLQLKLKHDGIEADVANNGEAGLLKMKEGDYDLVVLDLIMPVMDGFSVLKQMKDDGISIPTIVASNLSQVDDKKRSEELGAIDYFVKSNTSLVELVERIKSHL